MNKSIIYTISTLLILTSIFFISQIIFSKSSGPSLDTSPIPSTNLDVVEIKQKPSVIEIHNSKQTPQITPSPTLDPQIYACDPGGACNSYQDPVASGCPLTFTDRYCQNRCYDPSLHCQL